MKTFSEWVEEREKQEINESAGEKERREMMELLVKDGFVLRRQTGKHWVLEKDGATVTVTKNVRNPSVLLNKTRRQLENEKQRIKDLNDKRMKIAS